MAVPPETVNSAHGANGANHLAHSSAPENDILPDAALVVVCRAVDLSQRRNTAIGRAAFSLWTVFLASGMTGLAATRALEDKGCVRELFWRRHRMEAALVKVALRKHFHAKIGLPCLLWSTASSATGIFGVSAPCSVEEESNTGIVSWLLLLPVVGSLVRVAWKSLGHAMSNHVMVKDNRTACFRHGRSGATAILTTSGNEAEQLLKNQVLADFLAMVL